jgi:glycopeptide antibiotics resistance protein
MLYIILEKIAMRMHLVRLPFIIIWRLNTFHFTSIVHPVHQNMAMYFPLLFFSLFNKNYTKPWHSMRRGAAISFSFPSSWPLPFILLTNCLPPNWHRWLRRPMRKRNPPPGK